MAVAAGNYEVARMLVDHHCDINEKDNKGRTPLIVATEQQSHDVVKLLIDHHCNRDDEDAEGWTALSRAENDGDGYLVWLLQSKAGETLSRRDYLERRVRPWATENAEFEIVQQPLKTRRSSGDAVVNALSTGRADGINPGMKIANEAVTGDEAGIRSKVGIANEAASESEAGSANEVEVSDIENSVKDSSQLTGSTVEHEPTLYHTDSYRKDFQRIT